MSGHATVETVGAKKPTRETFAEIVARVPEASEPVEEWSHSIPRAWITVDGQRWVLRGDATYEGKELHKLLRQDGLPAFHDYMNKRTPIAVEGREDFWAKAQQLMADSEYSHFVGYQYKGPSGGTCGVIYEFC